MLPGGVLSTSVIAASFATPRNRRKLPLEDWARGGLAIQDPSQGIDLYNWKGTIDDVGAISLEVPDVVAPTVVYTNALISEFQFSFDQNMQPAIAFMESDTTARFRYFDTILHAFTVVTLTAGSFAPRCVLDDRRISQNQISDVIVSYLRAGHLYYRQQRDRFSTEYDLYDTVADDLTLGQFGFNEKFRLQWQFVPLGV